MSTQEFDEEVEETEESGTDAEESSGSAEEGEWESGGTVGSDEELGEGGGEQ